VSAYPRLAQLRTPAQFAGALQNLGLGLEFDERLLSASASPLAQPYTASRFTIGNRFCIQPMEGWDATADGRPTELTRRRWQRFGQSGAKLIWGGEAVAVVAEGRANPNQLLLNPSTLADIAALREALVRAHAGRWSTDDLFTGLQLTHSGRFCRPVDPARLEPRPVYHHPILDRKFGLPPDYPLLTDGEIEQVIEAYICAAVLAQKAGFHFVDVKHCHGYLGHEFLSALDRPGPYGGPFENRTRFLRQVVEGIRTAAPGLHIGVRLSAFDFIPFRPTPAGPGEPEPWTGPYPYAFGGDGTGTGIDLAEPDRLLALLESLNVRLVNLTAGNPYATPHILRPALFPPCDGYQPPEDPLVGVARQVQVTAALKDRHPGLLVVGSAYSYLQEWLPHVAQNVVRTGKADFVGLGRMVLPYPEICADVLEGRPLQRKRLCRTLSECTTAPRHGMVSGCYPLDPFYRQQARVRQAGAASGEPLPPPAASTDGKAAS
jgi:2,4-dienoyl-CoA reductase-like NADH-dependent reductase (Old Yellow Enzyme family)